MTTHWINQINFTHSGLVLIMLKTHKSWTQYTKMGFSLPIGYYNEERTVLHIHGIQGYKNCP